MADIPRGTSTNAFVELGDTFRSKIDTFGDRDWIRIDVDKGDWIQVDLFGRGNDPLEDPFLRIYDKDRLLVTEDDDSGDDFDSQATFKATKSGPYYIEAAGLDGDYKGQYGVTAKEVDAPAAQDPLIWGTQLDDTEVSVYFAQKDEVYDSINDCDCDGACSCDANNPDVFTAENWKAYEKERFEAAFDLLSDVSGLTFNVVNSAAAADFVLIADRDELDPDTLGFFNPPDFDNEGVGVFNVKAWDRSSGGDLEDGGLGFVTIVHELLHGLGMSHPHDDGGGSTIMAGVTEAFDDYGDFDLNQGVFTTMSYNSGYLTGAAGSGPRQNFGYEAGPMALDIAVLQGLYGANNTHKAGNSTYRLADENAAGTKWQAIWDTDGIDQITYDGVRDATIDLRAATLIPGTGAGGFISAAKGIAGGFTIANGVKIEEAHTGAGDDTLTGNGVANLLVAGRGNDDLNGRGAGDTLNGGKGRDLLDGGDGGDALIGGQGDDTLKGGKGGDTLKGGADFDVLRGGNGDDRLIGGAQADVLIGGGGADVMTGSNGADVFDFNGVGESSAGADSRDIITDFGNGGDRINLKSIDADATQGGNQAFDFIGRAAFSDAGQLRVVNQNGDRLVQADRNGDGQADLEILLQDARGITAGDFIL